MKSLLEESPGLSESGTHVLYRSNTLYIMQKVINAETAIINECKII